MSDFDSTVPPPPRHADLGKLVFWSAGEWRELHNVRVECGRGGKIAIWAGRTGDEQVALLRAFLATSEFGKQLVLADSADKLASVADTAFAGHVLDVEAWSETSGPADSGLVIMTSGTEGTPKSIPYSWEDLFGSAAVGSRYEERWLLAYSLTRFAGLQVLAHCCVNDQKLVIPADAADHASVAAAALEARVNCISCTPSWVRRLLLTVPREQLARLALNQVTLGGEFAPQRILDDVASMWPAARVTHIYASTEAGTCFSVSDGREGVPLDKLASGRAGKRGVLRDGQLFIEWRGQRIPTGDLFEQVGDRIVFRGRMGEVINVGGYKVSPVRVESVLAKHPAVRDIRAYGRRNPLVGECVAIDVVSDSPNARDEVMRFARENLGKPEWPMVIRIVDRIETSAADKIVRRKA